MNEQVALFCENEMITNPDLYKDGANCFNYTLMGENFINLFRVKEKDAETVFDSVFNWFSNWPGSVYFNL